MLHSQLTSILNVFHDFSNQLVLQYGLVFCISGIVVSILTLIITIVYFGRKKNGSDNENRPTFLPKPEFFKQKPRFRKRDKVRFYTTKMLRKVKQFKEDVLPGPEEETQITGVQPKKRRRPSGFKRFLKRQDSEIKRMLKEPPASMLEADFTEITGSESMLPPEVMFMLRSVRVFGHFEKPLFFELCKNIITKTLPKGKVLFRPGSMEEAIYIVQSGQINLYLVDKKGTEMLLKEVKPGENIYSVMNILDAIRGNTNYKYAILMRAAIDTTVLLLPSRAFKRIFEDNPESLVRVVQIVMLRLQQVTFMALHQFLGLSTELISSVMSRKVNDELKALSVYSLSGLNQQPKGGEIVTATTTNSTINSKRMSITSIQEDVHEKVSENIPIESSSPMKRTSSFSHSTLDEQDCTDGKISNTSSSLKRTGSHGKLVNLYGSSNIASLSGPNSDFEAVLGRVGMDLNEAGKISQNFEDDMISFDVPRTSPPVFEGDVNYGGLSKEQEDKMLAAARSDLVKLLTLPTPKLLDNILSIDVVPANRFLARQGDTDASLVFLVKGSLQMRQKVKGDEEITLFTCVPGEFVGSLSLLTGEPSFFSVKAVELSYVVIISKLNFYQLIKEHPKIVLPVANSMIQKLSSFVRNIDFALDWTMLEAGKSLFSQNDDPDSMYIILNGRLRAVQTNELGKKVLGSEYGRGEFVGLVDVLTTYPRTNSVHAVRDTELAQVPEGLLNAIKLHYPQVVSRLMQLLGDRILGMKKKVAPAVFANSKLERIGHNLGTVAVFPASSSVPLQNFTFELGLALNDIGPAVILTSDIITKRFGNSVWDSVHEYVLSNWLGYLEDNHRIVLYQCDLYMSEWTKRCVRQADIILIVGCGDQDPTVGRLESQLENMTSVRAQKDLILLYDEETFTKPTETIEWLNARTWLSCHHHVRCPRRVFKRRLLSERYSEEANYEGPSRMSDFARLARVLTGTTVGLVLGGGGARGISHVGIIKKMIEAGIPIDSVGGTSMGAFIGAIYAEHGCIVKTTQRAREGCLKMASMWRKLLDMTYPYTSLFTGKAFNREIESTFEDTQIEDMLLPYFCITTDISSSKMKVHQTGCLWRYVRASMSLSGYLPPICDPEDGHLLLDGGYVNNLPADIMRSMGAKTIVAVDVGSRDENELTNYGDSLSGFWMLWKKFNPFASPVRIPDMAGIQSRLAYVSCVRQLEEIKTADYVTYIRPPIDRFKTLQFGSFDEILEVGYSHGKAVFSDFFVGHVFPSANAGTVLNDSKQKQQITVSSKTAPSFTQLTDLVAVVKTPNLPRSVLEKRARLFEYQSEDDESDQDEVDFYAERGETLSDQETLPDSEYLSGLEEGGYESEDAIKTRPVYHRYYSNMT